jgi:GMP synthase (glutamine-hydrolysing)
MNKKTFIFKHVPHEGAGCIEPTLRAAGHRTRAVDVWRRSARWPTLAETRALVVMGGPMGVYEQDRYPYLTREVRFIRRMVKAGRPVLGICLGAQLIAHALGADVYPNDKKEIGWYPLDWTPAGRRDPLFRHAPRRSTVFQWHGDTFDLPAGATLLASSPLCRHQAFRYGKNVYGLQFHLEVDGAMIRAWLDQPGAERELTAVGPRARSKIERGLHRHVTALTRLAAPAFRSFAEDVIPTS